MFYIVVFYNFLRKIKEENERTPVQQDYAAFFCTIQQHSGKTMEEFCAAAGFDEKKLRIALQRGRIRLKTATHLLAANGYVFVFNYKFRELTKLFILDDSKVAPFDVDWSTYRHTDFLRNVFRIYPELVQKVVEKTHLSAHSIRYYRYDNMSIRRIFEFADCAGLDVTLLIKKDVEAAKILMQRLMAESNYRRYKI